MRQSLLALAVLSAVAAPLRAQCPDGTPPPCRGAPQPAPAEEASTFDSSTALVVPLTPVGADTSLRSLAATFSAIVAQNLTVGDVKAAVAQDLGALLVDERATAAARQRAGAIVDGTLIQIGTNVRATVRLACHYLILLNIHHIFEGILPRSYL